MNILTHPVTPIVAFVVVVAGIIAVVTTVRSKRRKERERQEKRAMEARVAKQIADEMFPPKPKPTRTVPIQRSAVTNRYKSRRKPSVPAPDRPGFRTDDPSLRRDDVDHNNTLFIPSLIVADMMYSDPTPSRDDTPSPSPSYDSGSSSSSSSYDSGSSSSSSDSGSSFSSDSGGGGDF